MSTTIYVSIKENPINNIEILGKKSIDYLKEKLLKLEASSDYKFILGQVGETTMYIEKVVPLVKKGTLKKLISKHLKKNEARTYLKFYKDPFEKSSKQGDEVSIFIESTTKKEDTSNSSKASLIIESLSPTNNKNIIKLSNEINRKIVNKHINNGVFIKCSQNVQIGSDVKIGKGTQILQGTTILGNTVIGENCTIGQNSSIVNSTIKDNTSVVFSVLKDCQVGEHSSVGPFAYIRPNSKIGDHVKVGDFVEVKNSIIEDGTKISHLTYVGDSDVGKNVNFGCGTVTVNYDSVNKYRTIVKDNAFIGCNTNLVAPVEIGENAFIAAGSTITKNVQGGTLAIARSEQVIKENWKRPTKN